jgi:hypothetical protein
MNRIVKEVWLLPVARGATRLLAFQLFFETGAATACRSYLVYHRPASRNGRGGQPGLTFSRSFAQASLPRAKDLDLRKPADARKLERALLALDMDAPET